MTTLEHRQSFTWQDKIEIQAVPGSPIGPSLIENGYIIKGLKSGKNIYYEPHGHHDDSLSEITPIDVIITPFISLKLPLIGAVIRGQETALKVCQRLKPQVILSTAAGGDLEFEGFIPAILHAEGSEAEINQMLQQNNLNTKAINLKSGENIELSLV